jgi:hypothetical protein
VKCALTWARSNAECATTMPNAVAPTNAIPMATTVLIANCVMPLRMLIPFMGEARACPCGYKYSALSNKPVTHVTACPNFLLTTLHNRRIAGRAQLGFEAYILSGSISPTWHNRTGLRALTIDHLVMAITTPKSLVDNIKPVGVPQARKMLRLSAAPGPSRTASI